MEELWLNEVSRRAQVVHLQVVGNQQNVREAVVLPDRARNWNGPRPDWWSWPGTAYPSTGWRSPPRTWRPMSRNCAGCWPNSWGLPSPRRLGLQFFPGPGALRNPLLQAALLPLKFIERRGTPGRPGLPPAVPLLWGYSRPTDVNWPAWDRGLPGPAGGSGLGGLKPGGGPG